MSVRDWHAERAGWRVVSEDLEGNPTAWVNERFHGDPATGSTISLTHPYPPTVDAAKSVMPKGISYRVEFVAARGDFLGFFWCSSAYPNIPLTRVRSGDESELRYLMAKMAIELGGPQ